ncbi:hypothetical protein [Thalassovita aquimarina]|uniref:hypothetical protein n=1 Tax=Thalassovita aquimarina TaxID=2785917 RepID=UPI001BB0495F|nr:hypothetical protein [Thalassovita aquimarina]
MISSLIVGEELMKRIMKTRFFTRGSKYFAQGAGFGPADAFEEGRVLRMAAVAWRRP